MWYKNICWRLLKIDIENYLFTLEFSFSYSMKLHIYAYPKKEFFLSAISISLKKYVRKFTKEIQYVRSWKKKIVFLIKLKKVLAIFSTTLKKFREINSILKFHEFFWPGLLTHTPCPRWSRRFDRWRCWFTRVTFLFISSFSIY